MDHDDSMISSPASPADHDESTFTHPDEDQEQDLFPSGTNTASIPRPQTPQNNHLNAAAPGELSPPRSQDQTQIHPPHTTTVPNRNRTNISRMATDTTSANNDTINSPAIPIESSTTTAAGNANSQTTPDYTPGSWKSSKSQDEMAKVWETNFVDRDFSGAVFGDPLSHMVPSSSSEGQGQQNGGDSNGGEDVMAVFRAALGL